jgi:cell division protein FtsB
MNVDLGIWGKLTRIVVVLFVVAGILGVAFWYLPLIQQNERYRQNILQLDAQIQKEDQASKQLKASIDSIRNDRKTVERLVRKQLGYVRPGEILVHFEAPATNSPVR